MMAEKEDIIKVKTFKEKDVLICGNCDKYNAVVDYNGNTHTFADYQINDKNANDIVKDLYVKVNALYRVLNSDNKEIYFNEVLLTIAELIFRLRRDIGVNQ